jgi:enoyl-CoA hydratase/carnithine racemase
MTYQTVIIEKKDGYAVVKFNRPHEMNAISKEMRQDLYTVFIDLEIDPEVKAIIITGGEYVFSAGMDIKEMSSLPNEEGT